MFGYIKPENGELLVKEYEQYKGVYCGLCKALGKQYGFAARLTLSYDCTFFALFLLGIQPEAASFQKGRCVVNPTKKCAFCTGHPETMRLPSALSVLSMYHKLKDDLHDAGFGSRLRSCCLLPLAIRPYHKACREFPELARIFTEMAEDQRVVEQNREPSLDACAEPTARMLSRVFALAAGSPEQERIFQTIGYFMGKWIYVMDAADDLADDLKKGAFNPLAVMMRLTAGSPPEDLQKARAYCNGVLNLCVSQIVASANLVQFHHFGPIIENVVSKGLPEMQRTLLFEKEKST